MLSINSFLLRTQNPGLSAVKSSTVNLNYAELKSEVGKTAYQLKKSGIAENDNVAIISGNNFNYVLNVLALWQIGAVPVPISTRYTQSEVNELLQIADCKIALIDDDISFDNLDTEVLSLNRKARGKDEFLSDEEVNPQNTAVIIFTSGTSGKAKGVELSFNSLLQSAKIGNQLLNHTEKDSWLASLPFYHVGGFSIITRSLLFRSSLVIPDSIKTEEISNALDDFHPTLASFVPTQLKRLIENEVTPNEELRMVLLGGGHVDNKLFSSAMYDGWNIVKVYGATETASFVTALTIDEWMEKPNSAGKAIAPNIVRVVSESRFQLNPGDIGEIAIYSPALMKGYYKNEEESNKRIEEGIYYSGDIGYMDEDNYLYIEAKRTDMIVTGGENVNPNEVEKMILEHPDVEEVAVFPLQDDEWGEVVTAAIVLKDSSNEITLEELEDFLKADLAGYKIPRKIFFEEELPKSHLGKILKSELIEKYS